MIKLGGAVHVAFGADGNGHMQGNAHIGQPFLPIEIDDAGGVTADGVTHVVDGQVAIKTEGCEQVEEGVVAFVTGAAAAMLDVVLPKLLRPAGTVGGNGRLGSFGHTEGAFPGHGADVGADQFVQVSEAWRRGIKGPGD